MSRAELRPGDCVFLCFLLYGPATAYDIKRGMAGSVSFFWTAAHSQVYQQASRLIRDGYVREKEVPGGRRKRLLSLTPAGRAAVKRWLASPAGNTQLFDESLVKLFFAPFTNPKATRAMLEDQGRARRETLAAYEALRPALAAGGEPAAHPLMTLDLGIRIEKAYLAWLDQVLASLPDSPLK